MSSISDLHDPNRTPISITVHDRDKVVKGKRLVSVAGDSTAFRLFAGVLNEMADAVESRDHPASKHGWSLVISPNNTVQLIMASDDVLNLACHPVTE